MSCVWVMLYGPDEYLYYQANSLGAIEINVASLGPIEFSEISLMASKFYSLNANSVRRSRTRRR